MRGLEVPNALLKNWNLIYLIEWQPLTEERRKIKVIPWYRTCLLREKKMKAGIMIKKN